MNDIFVIEDSFNHVILNEFDFVLNTQNFPWYSGHDISYQFLSNQQASDRLIRSENSVQSFALQHFVLFPPRDGMDSPAGNSTAEKFAKDVFWSVIKKHGIWKEEEVEIERLKFNLQTNNTFQQSPEIHNIPHVDGVFERNAWVMLVYCNSCDGDTVLFNERYDGTVKTEVTERMRVTPIKGRAIIFKADIFHASSNPIMNDRRLVMNANFYVR